MSSALQNFPVGILGGGTSMNSFERSSRVLYKYEVIANLMVL